MIITKNFPDLIKDKNVQIQEAKWISTRISKRSFLKVKLQNTKGKTPEKKDIPYLKKQLLNLLQFLNCNNKCQLTIEKYFQSTKRK